MTVAIESILIVLSYLPASAEHKFGTFPAVLPDFMKYEWGHLLEKVKPI